MGKENTLEEIIDKIGDPACRLVAKQALTASRRALDRTKSTQLQYISEEITKIMPKALKLRNQNDTSAD